MRKTSVAIIFLTVLIDLIGFGLLLPLIPVYSENFGATGWQIGAIMASYSAMQFIFAPIWGRLSDRVGRRPVLLASTACACMSYVIFALGSHYTGSTALLIILVSRIFAGICGANITVAQAYIADITPPEKRSARMGLIGMAFGLGFVLGPPLGGFSSQKYGISAPGWVAAGLCAINFLWAFARLGESWKPAEHSQTQRPHLAHWMHVLRLPRLNLLVGIFFLATFCFASFETTIGLLIIDKFHLDTKKALGSVSWVIFYCGVIGALSQGGVRGFVKRVGEPRLITFSLFMAAIGIGIIPFVQGWGLLLVALAVFSVGSSLTRPPVFGMISNLTPAHEQGATMGVAQGVGSLARIVGPVFATGIFLYHPAIPYIVCAVFCFITSLVALRCLAAPKPL
ncbi:MAG TPA: MFS transporter [Verrucomicrobiae bacterium]|jgi:multidrug resistance protein|nr:MFS transporter [Verrucomicrobiae bacterium]